MAIVSKWSGVAVAMQSAIATAQTITAITNASPGVASVTAHGYANGDYVLITAQGMTQINGRVFRVANTTSGTFELEGEDTSNYTSFTSGSVQLLTLGTSVSSFTDISGTGGDFDFIDTTTIHDTIKTQIPGSANPLTYTFDSIWDVSDLAAIAMKSASDTQAQRAFLFTFLNGQKMVFNGYVGAANVPVGSAQDKVTTPITITAFGSPTYYTT